MCFADRIESVLMWVCRPGKRVSLVVILLVFAVFAGNLWAATYYVDDDTGDDDRTPAVAQDPMTPWKTISRAVTEATLVSGDTIVVSAGMYNYANGEHFPMRLPSGVIIDANGAATIAGNPGEALFYNCNDTLVSGTTLSGFTLTHDAPGTSNVIMSFTLASADMAPQIVGNEFVGVATGDRGINIRDTAGTGPSFSALIADNSFSNLWQAVRQYVSSPGNKATFSPTISGNTFTNCDSPISIEVDQGFEGTVSPVIADNVTTGSVTDIFLDYYLNSGSGASLTPLITGNTLSGPTNWGIRLSLDNVSLSSANDVATVSPTILNNTIENAGADAIELDFEDLAVGTLNSNITIAGNTISAPASTGIELTISSFYSASFNLDCTVANNTITNASTGIDLSLNASGNQYLDGDVHLTVAGNTVSGGSNGIELEYLECTSCVAALDVTFQGNTVTETSYTGVLLEANYMTSFTSFQAEVRDNVVTQCYSGLDLYFREFPSPVSTVQVACNTITNNDNEGIERYDNHDGFPGPDVGGGDTGSPGLNTLAYNGNSDLVNSSSDVMAVSNWWGTTDQATISDHIWDYYDNSLLGVVDYSGWLAVTPTVSAVVELTDALEVDVDPSGPSTGDTIRYTATMSGTGDCGCASAGFSVPMPTNGTFVEGSLTASRGIVINDLVSTLHPDLIVGLGALEGGEIVTIGWDVVAGAGTSMTAQATLSCTQLGDVLSDDPTVGGSSDPTVTPLNLPSEIFSDDFESGDESAWSLIVP